MKTNGPTVTVAFPEGLQPLTVLLFNLQIRGSLTIPIHWNNNLRNQGIKAPPITRSVRSRPIIPGHSMLVRPTKECFLNQNTHFDLTLPIYSVSAPAAQSITANGQTYTANFYNWTGRNATFQNANAQQHAWVLQTQAPL